MLTLLQAALANPVPIALPLTDPSQGLSSGRHLLHACTNKAVVEMYSAEDPGRTFPETRLEAAWSASDPAPFLDAVIADRNQRVPVAERWSHRITPTHILAGNWFDADGGLAPPPPVAGCSADVAPGLTDLYTFLDDPSCAGVRQGGMFEYTDFTWTGPAGRVPLTDYVVAMSEALDFSSRISCRGVGADRSRCLVLILTRIRSIQGLEGATMAARAPWEDCAPVTATP
jgi:hypothetical protein